VYVLYVFVSTDFTASVMPPEVRLNATLATEVNRGYGKPLSNFFTLVRERDPRSSRRM